MKKTAIMVDSSADLSQEEAKDLNVFVIRMPLTINDNEYLEETDITDKEIVESMKSGNVVKTSQPVLGKIIEMWEEILLTYDELIYIPLSSKLSGTYHSATAASRAFGGKITVVDALSACCPIQLLVKYTKEMLEKGYECTDIKEKIENESYMFCSLIPADLVYLKRGGRISGAAVAIANALKIVPVLKVDKGEIDVLGKVRTRKKAVSFAMEQVVNVENLDDYDFVFTSCDVENEEEYIKEYEALINRKAFAGHIKAVVLAHVGPGTIGFARVKKIKY